MPVPVGAQLYTVRDKMRKPKHIEATLTRVAEIGYEYVQLSGFDYELVWMRALCDRLGLKIRLTHVRGITNPILNDPEGLIEEHRILGCPYIGLGGMPGQYRCAGGGRQFVEDYTPSMKKFAEAGLKFQYHNHAWEFIKYGGKTLFDELVEASDPALMGFTLDTYWVQAGGVDVVDLIRKLKGRIDVCHYKDMSIHKDKEQRMAAIGSGNLNWPGIIAAFEDIGTKYAFVEQDDCYGEDSLDELEKSFQFLQGI